MLMMVTVMTMVVAVVVAAVVAVRTNPSCCPEV